MKLEEHRANLVQQKPTTIKLEKHPVKLVLRDGVIKARVHIRV